MMIEVKSKDYDKAIEILDKENIESNSFENAYNAVCAEEINITLSYVTNNRCIELTGEQFTELVDKLSNELYVSNASNNAFQLLAEESELIINKELNERNYK